MNPPQHELVVKDCDEALRIDPSPISTVTGQDGRGDKPTEDCMSILSLNSLNMNPHHNVNGTGLQSETYIFRVLADIRCGVQKLHNVVSEG